MERSNLMNIDIFVTVIPHDNNRSIALSVHGLKQIKELSL